MAQAAFRSYNCKVLDDDLFLSSSCATHAPQTILAAGAIIVRSSRGRMDVQPPKMYLDNKQFQYRK